MKKTKDITKYDIDWQMVRSKVKGQKIEFEDKIKIVKDFWDNNKSIDNKERIMNWLEGLSMGYVSSGNTKAINNINKELEFYKKENPQDKETTISDSDEIEKIKRYDFKDRLILWKDLFKRNENWLEKGYHHNEHNHFMDLMWKVFEINKETDKIPDNYNNIELYKLRKNAEGMENTHKFFF